MRPHYYGDFGSLSFNKTGQQIIDRAMAMASEIGLKVRDREARIDMAAKESGMESAADVLLNLDAIREGVSGAGDLNLNVGIAGKLRGEIAARQKDKDELRKLRLIIENLEPSAMFSLTFAELEYFGF